MSGVDTDRRQLLLALGLTGVAACAGPGVLHTAASLDDRKIRRVFSGWAGPVVPVWTYRPEGANKRTPFVFVLHGQGRNAEDYLDQWMPVADAAGFCIAAPEFARTDFPDAQAYNQGNRFDSAGSPVDQALWSFSVIEPMFDALRESLRIEAKRYGLYGHSAGAQFVHRFLLFTPQARIARTVSANAGWYTMPDPDAEAPFGLAGESLQESQVAQWLSRPMTVLLGTADTDTTQSSLNRSPGAMAQGEHRLARGRTFFEAGRERAGLLGVPFGWRLAYAPDVAHDNAKMAPYAAQYL